jgi:hypothetical protein
MRCAVVDAVLRKAMARDKIHVNDRQLCVVCVVCVICAGRGWEGEGGVLWLTLFCARLWHGIRSM